MTRILDKLLNNLFRHYMAKPEEWLNATTAQASSDCILAPKFFKDQTVHELKKIIQSDRTRIVRCDFSDKFEVFGENGDAPGDDQKEQAFDIDGPRPDAPIV